METRSSLRASNGQIRMRIQEKTMKTMTFALALTTFAVLSTASAQLAQVRADRAAPRPAQSAVLAFTIDDSELRSMSIRSSSLPFSADGAATQARGSGGGAGKASFNDLSITMKANKATPMLMQYCATGQHYKKAVISVRKAGGRPDEYYTITMSDVLVSSYQTGGSSGDSRPMESLSLNFSKIEFDYKAKGDR